MTRDEIEAKIAGGQCDFFTDADSVPAEMQHLCYSCNKRAATTTTP